jgi:arsenate reductase-like glutaredoxin family protein
MAQRRATFLTYGNDDRSNELRTFIEEAGIILSVRDLKTQPMSVRELTKLLGHLPLMNFLNMGSPAFHSNGLEDTLPPRENVMRMIAEDQSLLRTPIVTTSRLLTVGYDKKKVSEMLQIGQDAAQIVGEGYREQPRKNGGQHGGQRTGASAGGK